jgi:hypothetical protein
MSRYIYFTNLKHLIFLKLREYYIRPHINLMPFDPIILKKKEREKGRNRWTGEHCVGIDLSANFP